MKLWKAMEGKPAFTIKDHFVFLSNLYNSFAYDAFWCCCWCILLADDDDCWCWCVDPTLVFTVKSLTSHSTKTHLSFSSFKVFIKGTLWYFYCTSFTLFWLGFCCSYSSLTIISRLFEENNKERDGYIIFLFFSGQEECRRAENKKTEEWTSPPKTCTKLTGDRWIWSSQKA